MGRKPEVTTDFREQLQEGGISVVDRDCFLVGNGAFRRERAHQYSRKTPSYS
jgi:hypothetical protein